MITPAAGGPAAQSTWVPFQLPNCFGPYYGTTSRSDDVLTGVAVVAVRITTPHGLPVAAGGHFPRRKEQVAQSCWRQVALSPTSPAVVGATRVALRRREHH